VAVDFHGEPLAYGELLRRASRLASHLRRLGTGPETRIGVCLERGPDMVVGVLAALFAGGAYVPLDPAHPARRQDDVLRDAGAATVVSAGSLGERLETAGHSVVRLDAHADRIAAEPADPPVPLAGPISGLRDDGVVDLGGDGAAQAGVEVVPGVELSAEHQRTSVHILCYWMDVANAELQAELQRLRDDERERRRHQE